MFSLSLSLSLSSPSTTGSSEGAGGEGSNTASTAAAEAATLTRLDPLLVHLMAQELGVATAEIVDLDLQLIDVQPWCLGGVWDE